MLRLRTLLYRLMDHEYSWLRIMLLALGIRLVALAVVAGDPLVSDSLYYQQVAENLVDHHVVDTYWPPGLPLYDAAVMWLFGKSTVVLRLAMLPWFFWLCAIFYRLAYRLHSRMAANMGLLMLAIYPAMVHQSVEPLSYLPAAALLLALFDLMQRYLDAKKRGLLWRAGILLGLLILFRPSAALFLVALPPLLLLRRKKFMPGFVLVLFAGLVVGAWIGYASHKADRWVPINDANARNFYLGNNPWTDNFYTWYFGSHWSGDDGIAPEFHRQLDSLDHRVPDSVRGRAYTRLAWQEIGQNPGRFGVRTLARMRTLLDFDTFAGTRLLKAAEGSTGLTVMAAAVLGLDALVFVSVLLLSVALLFSTARRELGGRDIALITGFLTVYSIPYWISFSHPSYHLPMVPLMLLLATVWVQVALRQESKAPKFKKKALAWLVIIALVGIQVEWAVRILVEYLA